MSIAIRARNFLKYDQSHDEFRGCLPSEEVPF